MTDMKKGIDKFMHKLEERKYMIIRVCFYIGVILLAYIPFMNLVMTSDYISNAFASGNIAFPAFSDYVSGGRFASYFIVIIYYFLAKLGVTHYTKVFVLQLMGMVLYAISAYIIYTILNDEDNKRIGFLDGVILFAYINPMMVETYVYAAFDFALGIYFAILGAQKFIERKYIQSFLFGFVAVSIYQSNILIMLIICLTAIFVNYIVREKKLNGLIKNSIFSGVLCVFTAGMNIGIQKILLSTNNYGEAVKDAKISGDLLGHVQDIIERANSILEVFYGMYPKNLLRIVLICICLAGIVVFGMKKEVFTVIWWILLYGSLLAIPFSFGIVTAVLWYPQRTMLSLMFSISMLLAVLTIAINKNQHIKYVFVSAVSIFFTVNYLYTSDCIVDCFIGQALDKNEAICIQKEIEKYELESGNKVDTIISKIDLGAKYTYSDIQLLDYSYATYNHRIMYDAWAQGGYLNYVNHTNYQFREMTNEEYSKYFEEGQWDTYVPSEQLVFEDNILYWAIY